MAAPGRGIDGSNFKVVNSRDRNFTAGKVKARRSQLDESMARYLAELDRAIYDPVLLPEARMPLPEARMPQLRDKPIKLAKLREQMAALDCIERGCRKHPTVRYR
ncbi:hypothetical protein [Stenotrophomonas sp. TWI1183]|uniref:hypothetical protein n=1 Tax=Stenotrophomonas sp. TWI1183 TaxID=3136799 RepID=UPI00320A504F